MSVTCWWLTKTHGDQLRFGFATELARRRRLLAFLTIQSPFEAFGDQAFAKILDRLHTAMEGLGDLDIQPTRPVGICLEQNLRATKPLR